MNNTLSVNAVLEYQKIYKQEFGEEITFDEAKEQGMRLLRLFDIVYKPIDENLLIGKK